MTRFAGEELVHRRQGTLGETLNGMPGIHLDSFGAGASKPVIRGQTVPRIEILSDGAQVFDASSASPDHAVVTDPLLLDAIEVVKGPVADSDSFSLGSSWNAYGLDGPADYLTKNMGIFVHEARSFGDFDIEFAARKDWREIDVGAPPFRANRTEEFKELFTEWYGADWFNIMKEQEIGYFQEGNPGAKHNPFSVSAGVTWHLQPNYDLMLSVARSERAPAVRELYARGNNLATNSYELGLAADNPLLADSGIAAEDVMETANSIDLTLHKHSGALQFELGIFYKDIDDYVFARLMEIENETGTPHKFLIYTAAETSFRGVDGQISYQATEQSRITVFGDYVDAELDNADDNLPRISPSRVGARYDWESGAWLASVEYYHVGKQDDIASYETPTESYNMANLTLSYSLNNDNSEIYLRATNLTDELAYVHTSFVKETSF